MIIDCPNCNKKFDIDQNLLPVNGRLLQCGSCNHKWFFKFNEIEKKTEDEIKIKIKKNNQSSNNPIKKKISIENEKIISKNKKRKKDINFFNILLVVIISAAACILILDTFKNQLIIAFPDIKFLLNNLYQSVEDIKLFILDLIK